RRDSGPRVGAGAAGARAPPRRFRHGEGALPGTTSDDQPPAGADVAPVGVAPFWDRPSSRSHLVAAVPRRAGQAAMTRLTARTPRPASPVVVRRSPSTARPRTAAVAGPGRASPGAVGTPEV